MFLLISFRSLCCLSTTAKLSVRRCDPVLLRSPFSAVAAMDFSDLVENQGGIGQPFGLYLDEFLVEVCLEGGVLMTSTEVLGSVGKPDLASSGPFSTWLHPAVSTIEPTSPASPSLPGGKIARSRADD